MSDYGTLTELNGRYQLTFERFTLKNPEHVFSVLTDSYSFSKWYPFATGEMNLALGGKIVFDDEEGSIYYATITELREPYLFSFREIDDLVSISLEENNGCTIQFTHTFDDVSWAVNTAVGWHRCLDVFLQMVNGEPLQWRDKTADLHHYYSKAFKS
ncbi:hypothetical protein GCM10008932_18100 [Alkalibacterium iburiense]|uniref:Activator of Hsp90 ATPase homologue 1/2-like C-terminal domain-containing protein n=1 Tax=Alkalibacterium iburiense TaxID=290589 RepID=A0ABP3HAM8_9LACT